MGCRGQGVGTKPPSPFLNMQIMAALQHTGAGSRGVGEGMAGWGKSSRRGSCCGEGAGNEVPVYTWQGPGLLGKGSWQWQASACRPMRQGMAAEQLFAGKKHQGGGYLVTSATAGERRALLLLAEPGVPRFDLVLRWIREWRSGPSPLSVQPAVAAAT